MDKYIKRLGDISESLSRISTKARSKEPVVVERAFRKDVASETIVYVKLKVSRPTEELTLILNSLKE